jgi:hypothetical protein
MHAVSVLVAPFNVALDCGEMTSSHGLRHVA